MPDNNYVYKKEIDWSILHQGVSIPVTIQVIFQNTINLFLPRGQSKDIFLILEGKTYKAKIVNQKFDERKYPNRKDILQIRYNPSSEIAAKLRDIFAESYRYILNQRYGLLENQRKFIKIPEEYKEYLAIYTTAYPDTYLLECITLEDTKVAKTIMAREDEQKYEASINYNLVDPNAAIAAMNQIVKIRKLNRAIGENLKLLYDYRCQICGENFGSKYGANITESHHIDPFVKSLNNNTENQIVVCPNHHRIIHRANPIFDRKKLVFIYDIGVQESIILNHHL